MSSLKKNFIIGFIWSFIGQVGYLIVALIANVVLARILSPYEFGQVGIVMFFIIISKVLTESGLSGALIRKKDVTDEDFSTVFIFNLAISLTLFLLLISCSGFIADFYNSKDLQKILIALSFVLIINAFQFTQNAKIVRDLKFKRQALYTLISVVVGSVIGISLALLKFGVWSLVIMQITTAAVLTLIYWMFEGHVEKLVFSKSSFKSLYKFGVNTTLASILNSVFDNIYNLILGKYFSIQLTGLYYQAKKIQEMPVGIIRSSTLGVLFSTLSKLQDDTKAFNVFYNRIVRVFTVLVGFICLLIFFYAEQIIMILYGQKWMGSVFFIKILIVASFFYMQEMFNRVLFKVFDRTDKILFLEIVKKIIQAVTVVVGVVLLDLEILLYGFLITSVISYFINYYYSRTIYENFSWQEIILVLKVIIIGIMVVVMLNMINNALNLKSYRTFYLLPILMLLYFSFIKIFKVANIIQESKLIIKHIKAK
jgi:teichuronic acid exporter